MQWRKLLAPAVTAAAVTLGGASVAGASNFGGLGTTSNVVAQEATETATATATTTATATATATTTATATATATAMATATATATATPHAKFERATEVCSGTLDKPALAILCSLWQGNTLPERQQEMLGALIVRIANVDVERPRRDEDKGEGHGQRISEEKRREACERFIDKHPEKTNERAEYCRELLGVSAPEATPTVATSAVDAESSREAAERGKQRGRSGTVSGKP